jgi:hypothetical protein
MSSDRERLRRLQGMAALVMDARSQTLRQANEVLEALKRQLADLEISSAETGLQWPIPEMARFGYEQWAVSRRAEINQRLAAQTVVCRQATEETRLAFGRKEALAKVAELERVAERNKWN